VSSAGSFLDGGGSRPLQRAAIDLLDPRGHAGRDRGDPRRVRQEAPAMLNGLRDVGFTVDLPPEGTFYVWASAQHLPPSISDGMSFFRAALEQKVIAVPGDFFDVDPGKRRGGRLALPPPPPVLVRPADGPASTWRSTASGRWSPTPPGRD
jgi:N-succinyldiaminopimelate aminotransferase